MKPRKMLSRMFPLILLLTVAVVAEKPSRAAPPLTQADFAVAPDAVKPWVYYWWLKGNVSREQITADLEQMREKGVGGILLFDSRGYYDEYDSKDHVPVPLRIKYEFMSPEWREMVRHTIEEAARLGMEVSINIANTGGMLRGPWDLKDDGPRRLIWSACRVDGPTRFATDVSRPVDKRYYEDVKIIAVRVETNEENSPETTLDEPFHIVTAPGEKSLSAGEIVDLEAHVRDGKLTWDVPAGRWKIFRFGHEVIGDVGSVDILNAGACTRYFQRIGLELIRDAGPHVGKTLTHFYNVSWEGSDPNWTPGFEGMFLSQNGYEMHDYLPVLAGLTVGDRERSQRFLRDYHRTLSHCFRKNCYATIGRLCHENGLKWHSENGGPWRPNAPMLQEADMLSFLGENDIPQGEFWVHEGANYATRSNMRMTAMASHIYGQKEAAVEAFTHMHRHWTMYPARLKPTADVNFIDGANKFIWHTFTASPPEVGIPGYEYFAGTHVNTNVTWWSEVTPFMDYLARCQYLLRQGHFAADACVYVSDRNFLNWGRCEKWNPDSPLVLPKGYGYDLLDTEVLVNRLEFRDGKLVLPDGMSYRFLVFDPTDDTLPVESLEKIVRLVSQGATVVLGDKRPVRTPGLKDYPACDRKIRDLAETLWEVAGEKTARRKLGKGTIVRPESLESFLREENLLPDFSGPFEYHHRSAGNKDVYFVTGTGNGDCFFRVAGKKPQLWDAVTGKVLPPVAYDFTEDGRTRVPLNFAHFGSIFVVFDGETGKDDVTEMLGPPDGLETVELTSQGQKFVQWKNGPYRLTTASGKRFELKADLPAAVSVAGPWEVLFDPTWGGPEKTVFEKLVPWNEHPDPAVKYYSGTATYVNTFSVDENQAALPARLSVGAAHNVARVRLNGKEAGILWTAPRTIDITGMLRPGENRLEIDVTNCWVNRLIGDAGLPPERRITKTNLYLVPERKVGDRTYRVYQGFSAQDELLLSGLLDPIMIEFGKTQKIEFE